MTTYSPLAIGKRHIDSYYIVREGDTPLDKLILADKIDSEQSCYLRKYTKQGIPVTIFPHKGKTFIEVDPYLYFVRKDNDDPEMHSAVLNTSIVLRMRAWDGSITNMEVTYGYKSLIDAIDNKDSTPDEIISLRGKITNKEMMLISLFPMMSYLKMNFTGIPDISFYYNMFKEASFDYHTYDVDARREKALMTNLEYIMPEFKGDPTPEDFISIINLAPSRLDKRGRTERYNDFYDNVNHMALHRFKDKRKKVGSQNSNFTIHDKDIIKGLKDVIENSAKYLDAGVPITLHNLSSGKRLAVAASVDFQALMVTDKYLNKLGDINYENLLLMSAGFIMQHPANVKLRDEFIEQYCDGMYLVDILEKGVEQMGLECIVYVNEDAPPFFYSKENTAMTFINQVMYMFKETTFMPNDIESGRTIFFKPFAPREVEDFAIRLHADIEEDILLNTALDVSHLAQYIYMYLLTLAPNNPLEYLENIAQHFFIDAK